ncbi:putative zinc-finger protein [Desulforapulum autotrophicum HRM2]|uniref:Zinc-finger protein n=1 Tax=Desulforapulum autotrophicum (strain ATCC 43914 / DSM 3382 / VKM B-1955 / HRM2) TaxID=177437 RepID=C0QF52_DESAH|nr:methylenetetrahydrofolate reductase C-terminal domain-containing protein [Desulforapulum autotrophicum]ACN17553.1 putative zinc-finger protein [Desulforapulum autotrophicum HRM2]
MVKVKQKNLKEIIDAVQGYDRLLIVGCGGCASVCLGGGQREVDRLCMDLNFFFKSENRPARATGYTLERQCNPLFLEELQPIIGNYDCVLSMACGAGCQYLAETYPETPIFPAVNTVAIGIDREIGVYEERCRACGACVLGYTGGVCPVTRCAKGLFNGPCGGTNKGMCEVNPNVPCAWIEIYNRLKKQDRLDNIMKITPAMEWQNQVQRTLVQER